MGQYSVVGKRIPRVDGKVKATGNAKYAGDMELPGMLHGKILWSPHPHAKILNIDTTKAERAIGVKAIITGRDFGGFKYGFLPTTRDKSPLAVDKVRYIGDEVAAVCATDKDTAEEALELIEIEYEGLPAVFDPEEAMKEGAPAVHDNIKNNLSAEAHMHFGDVEQGFRQSDHIREDTFRSQSVLHGFLEPHAALAYFDPSGKITIWASKQSPYFLYRNLSNAFSLPLNRVRVIQPFVGGGFGGKNASFALDFCSALLSKKTGKPVKIVYTQEEVLAFGRRRHPMILHLKTGVKRDGTLVASHCKVIADGGAYTDVGPLTIYLAGVFMTMPYRLPNVKYDAYRAFTNKPISVAQRGNGVPQIRYAAECQLDLIARDLGMDPIDIRLKNAIAPGYVTPNNLRITTCGLMECIDKAIGFIGGRSPRKNKIREAHLARGGGIACNAFVSGARLRGHNACGAIVKIHEDGSISLLTGATDSGQGAETVLAQIAAEELGVQVSDIEIVRVDSEITPVDPGSYGSRVTSLAGRATQLAARDAKRQLLKVAAQELGAGLETLESRDGKVFSRGNPDEFLTFHKLARMACYGGGGRTIMGKGSFGQNIDIPNWEKGEGNLSAAYSFGAQVAEVEVDKMTGKVRVLKMGIAHDCGFPINPMGVEGQLEGTMANGLGQALYEGFAFDGCQTLNPTLGEYGLPTALDMPLVLESIPVQTHEPEGPFGAKEAGEGTQVSTIPAIINAIYDATGVMIKKLPITPEKILEGIDKVEREGRR